MGSLAADQRLIRGRAKSGRSVPHPLHSGDEHQFVGLVHEECHQTSAVRPKGERAQRARLLTWPALVLRRVDGDNRVKQFQ